jgi:acid phosphatase
MKFSLFILISIIALSISADKLVFVLTHFRHGARAPQYYYDQENHLDYILEKWERPGELTAMGQRMHYLLGLRNRERYINNTHFLSEKFDPHEILIYSSQFNRTLLSAESQLQGLYPQYLYLGEILHYNF